MVTLTESRIVLSEVHTDCQFQKIPRNNCAVTRFKVYFPISPSQSVLQNLKPGTVELERDGIEGKDEDRDAELEHIAKSEPETKLMAGCPAKHGQSNKQIYQETKLTFDEDGDAVVNRSPDLQFNKNLAVANNRRESKLKFEEVCIVNRSTSTCVTPKDDTGFSSRETAFRFDEDGDLVLDRSHLRGDDLSKRDSKESPDRKKIKLDFQIMADKEHSNKHVTERCERKQESEETIEVEGCINCSCNDCGCNGVTDPKFNCCNVSLTTLRKQCDTCNLGTRHRVITGDVGNRQNVATCRDWEMYDVHYLTIKHSLATELGNVGEQVWLGALLLGDYIMCYHGDFENKTIIDLGAGVGLSSIIAAMYATRVYCTDTGEKVLSLADDNVSTATTCQTLPKQLCTVHVKQLDWFTGLEVDDCKYGLTQDDISQIYNCDILIAADVIYDFDLTDAFFNVVKQIMSHPPAKSLYIGLEKRLVFTVEDLAVTSPGYNYFKIHLMDLCSYEDDGTQVHYQVEQIDAKFHQYFKYKRTKHLEIWKISAVLEKE